MHLRSNEATFEMARVVGDSILDALLAFILFVLLVAGPALLAARVWAVVSQPRLNKFYRDYKPVEGKKKADDPAAKGVRAACLSACISCAGARRAKGRGGGGRDGVGRCGAGGTV
jgi:hypothetical protein